MKGPSAKKLDCWKMNRIKRVALIDGDVVAYRCGFAAQHKEYSVLSERYGHLATVRTKKEALELIKGFDEMNSGEAAIEVGTHIEPIAHTLHTVKLVIQRALEDTDADEYKVYLSKGKNFRYDVATLKPYKGNRKEEDKPTHLKEIRDYLMERYSAIEVEGIEADDQISIDARKINGSGGHLAVVCSVDKDLKQIPGMHYNIATHEHDYVTDEEALYNLYSQILTGDSVDNIPGLKGIGPKTAKKILAGAKDEQEMWERAVKKYIEIEIRETKNGKLSSTEIEQIATKKAQENARLVYILQEEGKQWNER